MFTGIIESAGKVKEINGIEYVFSCDFSTDLVMGESVAVSGTCVTVTRIGGVFFAADVIEESRNCTSFSQIKVGDTVNFERSARIGDRNSGHMVLGHVDETGVVQSVQSATDFWLVRIGFSPDNFSFVIHKGSIAIDGISLTVSKVSDLSSDPWFEVSIIPHTWEHTNLHTKQMGDLVNLEFDQIGKYIQKHLQQT